MENEISMYAQNFNTNTHVHVATLDADNVASVRTPHLIRNGWEGLKVRSNV